MHVAALLVAGAAHAVAGTTEYQLGPRDVLQVQVIGTEFGGQYTVGSAGTLSFPWCESLSVGGKSVAEAETALRDCLRDGVLVDPQVMIRIDQYRSQKVEVTGSVKTEGPIYLQGPTTVRAALGQAGGVVGETNNGAVVVIRGDERFELPLRDLGGAAGSMEVLAGDVVSVDQGQVVFVEGVGVSKPGTLAFVDGMTAYQALVRAGGATQVANLGAAYVLRNGEKISVNLRKIRDGKAADIVLLPGDQLVVPESPI